MNQRWHYESIQNNLFLLLTILKNIVIQQAIIYLPLLRYARSTYKTATYFSLMKIKQQAHFIPFNDFESTAIEKYIVNVLYALITVLFQYRCKWWTNQRVSLSMASYSYPWTGWALDSKSNWNRVWLTDARKRVRHCGFGFTDHKPLRTRKQVYGAFKTSIFKGAHGTHRGLMETDEVVKTPNVFCLFTSVLNVKPQYSGWWSSFARISWGNISNFIRWILQRFKRAESQ